MDAEFDRDSRKTMIASARVPGWCGEVLGHLQAMEPRPTIVVIAHRPESLAYCCRVVRFKDGRLSPQ